MYILRGAGRYWVFHNLKVVGHRALHETTVQNVGLDRSCLAWGTYRTNLAS